MKENCDFPGNIPADHVLLSWKNVRQNDDYQAFEALFNQFYNPLCSFCRRLVILREVAEELVSDVFYSIWKNRKRLEVSNIKAYLYSAVRNRAIDHLRSRKMIFSTLESAVHLPSESYTLHDILEHRELSSRVDRRISMLPKRCKMIYELSRHEGMRHKEIALTLSISVKTVETQLGKAIRELRKTSEIES